MLIPTKYENINYNLLVLGAYIISLLKKKPYNIEELFQVINKIKEEKKKTLINLDQYFNTLTFLWLSEIILLDEFKIYLNNNNDSKETLFNS